jgi:hypothetical protein
MFKVLVIFRSGFTSPSMTSHLLEFQSATNAEVACKKIEEHSKDLVVTIIRLF